jgi:hypothetical protein
MTADHAHPCRDHQLSTGSGVCRCCTSLPGAPTTPGREPGGPGIGAAQRLPAVDQQLLRLIRRARPEGQRPDVGGNRPLNASNSHVEKGLRRSSCRCTTRCRWSRRPRCSASSATAGVNVGWKVFRRRRRAAGAGGWNWPAGAAENRTASPIMGIDVPGFARPACGTTPRTDAAAHCSDTVHGERLASLGSPDRCPIDAVSPCRSTRRMIRTVVIASALRPIR